MQRRALIRWARLGLRAGRIAIVIALAAARSAPLVALTDPNTHGRELLQAGDPRTAGVAWLAAAAEQSREGSNPGVLRQAALSAVLATIAFERARDGRAYVAWSQAIRWWLEAGTSWEVERAVLGRRVREIQASLRGAEVTAGGPTPAAGELQLLALASATGFLDYSGPRPGLPSPQEDAGLPIPVQRDYFARPLGVEEEEKSAPETRGRVAEEPPPALALDPTASPAPVSPAGLGGHGLPSAGSPAEITPAPTPSLPPPAPTPEKPAEPKGEAAPLAMTDLAVARAAWRYFVAARQENTGLYNSVAGYPYATLWDLGSGLAGLVAAEQLHILDAGSFHRDAVLFLTTLREMSLYKGELPNREYQTQSGRMVDLLNHPSPVGSGWSALDLGRLLIWLRITADFYPDLRPRVEKVVQRFDFSRLAAGGEMHGAIVTKNGESLNQEGRLGYEQYAAAGYALWGVALQAAHGYGEIVFTPLDGQSVPRDRRENANLTSDPFILAGLELGGIDPTFQGFTETVHAAQRRRFETTRMLTAVGEDALDQEPWFAYNSVFADDRPWQCRSAGGRDVPELRTLGTKAAFGWAALYPDDYGKRLRRAVEPLLHPRLGFYAGIYERDGATNKAQNVNTNAVILEAMLFLQRGGKPFLDLPAIPAGPEPQRGTQR